MQLTEAGKIELDAPVQAYLPWFALADKDASTQITVRHLLNQTSGVSQKDGNRYGNSSMTPEEAVRQMNAIHLSHPAGTKFEYSNLNYVAVGLIVEIASGQSYADYVMQHILTPLDMRNPLPLPRHSCSNFCIGAYCSRPSSKAPGLSMSC